MPATSSAQRRLFALAEHHPDQLNSANKGLAKLPHQTLHDFAATPEKGLPHHVPHMADGGTAPKWGQKAFAHSGEPGHSLHATLHVPEGKTIPPYRVREAAHSNSPHERHQAQAALNMNKRFYGQK